MNWWEQPVGDVSALVVGMAAFGGVLVLLIMFQLWRAGKPRRPDA